MVIATNKNGNEIGVLHFRSADIDAAGDMNFEICVDAKKFDEETMRKDNRVFVPNTEFGGIIKRHITNTDDETITLAGRTWRGYLASKIVRPPTGDDYKIVTGDLHVITKDLIQECGLNDLFHVATECGVDISGYKISRYISLLDALTAIYSSEGRRLDISYMQSEGGVPGVVLLSAEPIVDYSEYIELSQDNRLSFVCETATDSINHLICLGKGELASRTVIDLFIQKDGSIGSQKYFGGLDEFEAIYENVNAEDDDLIEEGEEKLKELHAKNNRFSMNIDTLAIDANIGDSIGGRDYLSGTSMVKPIKNKIYKEENGIYQIEYKLEE